MSDGNVEISRATLDNLPQVAACARAAYEKYVDRMGKKPAPMTADYADQIRQGIVHVARREQTLVGYVVFYPEDDHMHLENVAVLPAQAGQGIGRQLIDFVERATLQCGLDAVELYTNESMTENLAMYPKLGYVEVDRRRQSGFDRVFFRKTVA